MHFLRYCEALDIMFVMILDKFYSENIKTSDTCITLVEEHGSIILIYIIVKFRY